MVKNAITLYKPVLNDLSQGSRIAFARQFRQMSLHTVANKLGVQHDNKRRLMTRYEKGERNPKNDRAKGKPKRADFV